VNKGERAVTEGLVKWKHLSIEEVKRFPNFDLEARSNLRGEH